MKVVLIYGFLGAGKTTLIRNLLRATSEPGQVAVLVNDVTTVNVDAPVLQGQHLQVLPMASGCLCCTLSGAFAPAVLELRDKWNPEWLVIEPSGIAAPYALEALLERAPLKDAARLASVVTVVALPRFLTYESKLGEFYRAQVEAANVIVLNKADLVAPEQGELVGVRIRELNPEARVLVTEYARLNWADLLGDAPPLTQVEHEMHGPPLETCEIELGPLTGAELEALIFALKSGTCGHVYRAKGIVEVDQRHLLINYADGEWSAEPLDSPGTPFVVIGEVVDCEVLQGEHAFGAEMKSARGN